mmetsp:Transcript_18616/g.32592  ORF Transcript_18616/g.32592 Transcript_18616/m.32592 type:complete len:226 (-) Transcript_18616:128-805(-)|eukprot:CAMPEP_0197659310 /NCGR_PEP_ID=MMETSP1338-20131121/47168_1 /TAXON_ID=43686 ORGANISM="Pelagodinium beii, Strain RCC1491" /NCGR_SAMPLE_ID=MMETSP1338 /ASSEMBLY_ACC=CAM_ASM_000754 /LENGTH=225 /DNA_ID=CAMNT_0043236179 /DNA_START=69 /DNA_END=746 /DNA_ORIENTATION=-
MSFIKIGHFAALVGLAMSSRNQESEQSLELHETEAFQQTSNDSWPVQFAAKTPPYLLPTQAKVGGETCEMSVQLTFYGKTGNILASKMFPASAMGGSPWTQLAVLTGRGMDTMSFNLVTTQARAVLLVNCKTMEVGIGGTKELAAEISEDLNPGLHAQDQLSVELSGALQDNLKKAKQKLAAYYRIPCYPRGWWSKPTFYNRWATDVDGDQVVDKVYGIAIEFQP